MIENTKKIETHKPPLEELLVSLESFTPRVVKPFTPSRGKELQQQYISGEEEVTYQYPVLEDYDFETARRGLKKIATEINGHTESNPKYETVYQDAIKESLSKLRMLEIAHLLHSDISHEERDELSKEFMEHNIDVYGEPERNIYDSLLDDTANLLKSDDEATSSIVSELKSLLPSTESTSERFKPSDETQTWVKRAAETLYAGMLKHVDMEKEAYSASELRDLFETVLRNEFGEVADDWGVELSDDATGIEVQRIDKKIIIPAAKKPISPKAAKGLIAHEQGVHFLKALSGSQTDLKLMQFGLKGYYDVEEGLGIVMQQAVTDGFKPGAGENMYLAASLAYFENMSSNEVYEIMWRKSLLEKHTPGNEVSNEDIDAAKKTGYAQMRRIFRGTDTLPLFKDLSYLTGTESMWKYLETIKGDDFSLTLTLQGKINPLNAVHMRTMLETKSV